MPPHEGTDPFLLGHRLVLYPWHTAQHMVINIFVLIFSKWVHYKDEIVNLLGVTS